MLFSLLVFITSLDTELLFAPMFLVPLSDRRITNVVIYDDDDNDHIHTSCRHTQRHLFTEDKPALATTAITFHPQHAKINCS